MATLRADERGTARMLAISRAEGWRMAVVLKTCADGYLRPLPCRPDQLCQDRYMFAGAFSRDPLARQRDDPMIYAVEVLKKRRITHAGRTAIREILDRDD